MKSRALAAEFAELGRIRVLRNGATHRIEKASAMVRPGDQLTFLLNDRLRILAVLATAARRGPAIEARSLYDDLSPAAAASDANAAPRAGRPTKRDRRAIRLLKRAD